MALTFVGDSNISYICLYASSNNFKVKLAIYLLRPCSQDAIFRVIAAILHLGNIKFEKSEEETDSSVLADKDSKFHLETTAELLMYG